MSSPTSINAGFAGTGPYRITSPTIDIDATAGLTEVDANVKFATNLPLGFGMLITDIDWVVPVQTFMTAAGATGQNIWQILGQLTEALSRTIVAQSDNIDVDIYFDEMANVVNQQSAIGEVFYFINRQKALERHHLGRPWLSVAQNLNLVGSIIPTEQATQNGPEAQIFCRIYFDIITLTAAQQAYLAQRIQIAGQA